MAMGDADVPQLRFVGVTNEPAILLLTPVYCLEEFWAMQLVIEWVSQCRKWLTDGDDRTTCPPPQPFLLYSGGGAVLHGESDLTSQPIYQDLRAEFESQMAEDAADPEVTP